MKITNRGNDLSIVIPLSVFDIRVSDYIDFRKCVERFNDERSKQTKDFDIEEVDNFINEKATIIEAVSYLCSGDIDRLPFDLKGRQEGDAIYTQSTPFEDFSILGLFYHIQNIADFYEVDERILNEKEYSFEYQNETYFLNGNIATMTTGTTLEVLEIERLQSDASKKEGDSEGVKEFTKLIRTCAILCRKKGERLPLKKKEREQLIEQRTEILQGITLNITNDISFFLFGTIINLAKTQDTDFSLRGYQVTQV
jgi:hypothetical protein